MASKKTKSGKNDSDVADRLREIKQMQASWMKQRQMQHESGNQDPEPTRGREQTNKQKKSTAPPSKANITKKEPDACVWVIGSGQKKKKSSSVRARSSSPARRITTSSSGGSSSTGSGSRMSSRSNSGRTPTYGKPPTPKTNSAGSVTNQKKRSDYKPERERRNIYGSEPDLSTFESSNQTPNQHFNHQANRTSANSFDKGATYNIERIHHVTPPSTATDDLNNDDDGEGLIGGSKKLMDPEMFNKLADQIANRVKAEIEQEQYIRPRRTNYNEDDDAISSHKCSKCKQLMIPPDHTPTLLIPCGHTFCEACAEDRIKCPTCRTKVSSVACNTTLQAIIQDFFEKKPATGGLHSGTTSSSTQDHGQSQRKQYSPANYVDRGQKHRQNDEYNFQTQRTENSVELGRHYAEEYQSLMIRAEALQNEKENIHDNFEEVAHKLNKQKKQMGNIEREEQKLIDQIAELQERLETLQTHKNEYQEKLKELEDTQQEDTQRLAMIDETLKTIHNSMEKAKMLAGNFNVHIGD
ncbi:uncharacterized protein LOC144434348 [Glandiceps talaboti]